ncbi:hypothetical protein [Flavobacterium sp.]|uniref:hypothetical protein n=1 Tax=Flavobacterium sp. TaxID=239 RepID=UPI002609DCFF|nr:hypothetical protein [Flavobacterium sp.]
MRLYPKIIAELATLCSFIGFVYTFYPDYKNYGAKEWIIIGIFIISFIITVSITIYDHLHSKSKSFPIDKKDKIKKYMNNWIKNTGRVAIFTRDMSWLDEKSTAILIEKAEKKELIICLPKEIDAIKAFKDAGAEIVVYNVNYDPKVRFTITNYGLATARIAVGRGSADGKKHIIDEYKMGENFCELGNDIVSILKTLNQNPS